MGLIAPSILAADFANLQKEVEMINGSEADWLHIDVMDGVFVPNISLGIPIVEAIHEHAKKPLDVHLMIVQPERYIESFQKAGASVITVHLEACPHLHRTLGQIKDSGCKAGVALNPHTPVTSLEACIDLVDVVCIMSVNPGFSGQKFIERTYDKVQKMKALITNAESKTLVEVDGGVSLQNAPRLLDAGADVLVAGNTVFGASSPAETIAKLKGK